MTCSECKRETEEAKLSSWGIRGETKRCPDCDKAWSSVIQAKNKVNSATERLAKAEHEYERVKTGACPDDGTVCPECCAHEFDWDEGGYCLNCDQHQFD